MATANKFEDLVAWQKARELTKAIYLLTSKDPFAKDLGLKTQIQRSAVSTMSNIAEGFERKRNNEFHQFLSIAKGSCAEVRSQLYVAFDIGYITEDQFKTLLTQAEEVGRIVGGLRSVIAQQKAYNS